MLSGSHLKYTVNYRQGMRGNYYRPPPNGGWCVVAVSERMFMKAEAKELLPCPFCGYEASITEIESASGGGRITHIVGCNSEDCDVSFHGHARQIDAATAWNTRVNSDLTGRPEPYKGENE